VDRWVCTRCFTSNDGDATTCAQCGLERGAVPPPGDAAVATQETAGERKWWMPLLRFWWVGALVVLLAAGFISQARHNDAGQIQSAGKVDITDLRVGDCYDADKTDEISEVTGRPCSETHEYELFAIVQDTEHDAYPGDAGFDDLVARRCLPEFEVWVGKSLDSSTLDIFYVIPSEDSWGQGDRSVACAVYDRANSKLTGSVKGSRR
jgi:hypothetical protein